MFINKQEENMSFITAYLPSFNKETFRNGCDKYADFVYGSFSVTAKVAIATYETGAGFVGAVAHPVETAKWLSGYSNFKAGIKTIFTQDSREFQNDADILITREDNRSFPRRVGDMGANFTVGAAKLATTAAYIVGSTTNYSPTATAMTGGINGLLSVGYNVTSSGIGVGLEVCQSVLMHPVVSYQAATTVATVVAVVATTALLAKGFAKAYDGASYVATTAKSAASTVSQAVEQANNAAASVAHACVVNVPVIQ